MITFKFMYSSLFIFVVVLPCYNEIFLHSVVYSVSYFKFLFLNIFVVGHPVA
jgi:hypothetical protein